MVLSRVTVMVPRAESSGCRSPNGPFPLLLHLLQFASCRVALSGRDVLRRCAVEFDWHIRRGP